MPFDEVVDLSPDGSPIAHELAAESLNDAFGSGQMAANLRELTELTDGEPAATEPTPAVAPAPAEAPFEPEPAGVYDAEGNYWTPEEVADAVRRQQEEAYREQFAESFEELADEDPAAAADYLARVYAEQVRAELQAEQEQRLAPLVERHNSDEARRRSPNSEPTSALRSSSSIAKHWAAWLPPTSLDFRIQRHARHVCARP